MKIALTQFAAQYCPKDNLQKQISLIKEAAAQDAKIVCTQELFMSKYFCIELDQKYFDLAEPIPCNTTEELCKLAKSLDIVIVASLFENRGNEIFHNTAIIIDADGKIARKYRKMHIPHDPHFEEKYYFTEGDSQYGACDTKYGRIGVLVCWDQWYPEAARITALDGANIIFYPTAIGGLGCESKDEVLRFRNAWQTVQRGHAVANGAFIAAANRIGTEFAKDNASISFWGNSFCVNPYGEIIAQAAENSEQILLADVDYDMVKEFRRTWPFFRDRRIDSYGAILKRRND